VDELIGLSMQGTDDRIRDDKPVTPGFMIAVLLWQDYQARTREHEGHSKPAEARFLAASDTLAAQARIMTIPRRFSQFARDVWTVQERLIARRPRSVNRLLAHPRFRAGYDFLLLRAEIGDAVGEEADWWTRLQDANEEERAAMEERMAANLQDNQQAFNAAETGIAQAFEDGGAFDLTQTVTRNATEIATSDTYAAYSTEFRGWSKPPLGSLYSATSFNAAHFDIEATGTTDGGASAELHGGAYQIAPKSN